jgi:hypothetical protein
MNEDEKFKYFIDYIRDGNVNMVKNILKDKNFNPIEKDNAAIKLAVITKKDEILKLLLDNHLIQNTVDYNQLLKYSKDKKITEIIKNSKSSDKSVKINTVPIVELAEFKEFLKYVEDGDNRQVKKILEEGKVNPSREDNKALKLAAEIGHTEISRMLLDDVRVADTVNYNEIAQIASDNSNKRIEKLVEDAFLRDKKRSKGERIMKKMSPIEFKSVRKIIARSQLEPIIEFKDFDKDLKDTKIEGVELNLEKLGYAFEPLMTVIPKSNILDNKEFRTFLCDFELFNWISGSLTENNSTHRDRRNLRLNTIYPLFTLYLGRMFGNDVTIFTSNTISLENSLKLLKISDFGIKTIDPDFSTSTNRMFNFPKLLEIVPNSLKPFFGNDYNYYSAFFVREYRKYPSKFLYVCHYSDLIFKKRDTRYSFINVIYLYSGNNAHYTFIFVDHQEKLIEYYDPHIIENKKEAILFTYKALETIFEDYKINKFWRLSSIQKTEEYEKDEVGFCVKWGHMMMHLKMLNMSMPINEIEERFIQECESKNISLYEVVLNYTYLMGRIIPPDDSTMIQLRNILK